MDLIQILISVFILLFSIVVHEYSHGFVAYLNGDDTARVMGRLTLNPLPHIDLIGTIILPLFLIFLRVPFVIGMAKPVPINPLLFRNYEKGIFTVGLAGPLSNILLGIIFSLLYRIYPFVGSEIRDFFLLGGYINITLALFNLIPIPPLDGSRIISIFLPFDLRMKYERMERYGIFVIILLMSFGVFSWIWPISKNLVNKIGGG